MIATETLEQAKQEAIDRIRAIVDPHLKPTNWIKSRIGERPRRYVQCFLFAKESEHGALTEKTIEIEPTFTLIEGIIGFTDTGVATDVYMALVTHDYLAMPLEDLMTLADWVENEFYSHARM